jgi:hypothetical protein
MILLKVVCWVIIVSGFITKWDKETYLPNSLLVIASMYLLYLLN